LGGVVYLAHKDRAAHASDSQSNSNDINSICVDVGTKCTSTGVSFPEDATLMSTDITIADFGVDVSWPIHHGSISTNYAWLPHNLDPVNHATPKEYLGMPVQPLGDRSKVYQEFMSGCREFFGTRGSRCDATETERIKMNLDQPCRMTNYTELGFKKVRAPEEVFRLIEKFWHENRHNGKVEEWGTGYTYTNNWLVNSTMVSVEDSDMIGGGYDLKNQIWNMAQNTISEWVGRSLETTSLYGIRVYHEGAILATHVDRLPLVSSAIINVDQDPEMEVDWPLEVYGHDGKVYNISMKPGDMVMYESHSLLHGRPFALKGKYYANIFIHFEPVPFENAARLAQLGDLEAIKKSAELNRQILFERDENKWQPLHEAVCSGHTNVVRYLLEEGAEINSETKGGNLALDWAYQCDASEQMIQVLIENGGLTRNDYIAKLKLESNEEL